MEQVKYHLKMMMAVGLKHVGEYILWFIQSTTESITKIFGEYNQKNMSSFLEKHAFACVFGSMVFAAFVFQYRHRKGLTKQQVSSSDNDKNKKSISYKLPQKLKSKVKFISSEDQNPQQDNINYYYESTLQSKKYLPNYQQRRNKGYPKQQQFQRILEKQVDKVTGTKAVPQDSGSDKVFHQMYGMYRQSLQQE